MSAAEKEQWMRERPRCVLERLASHPPGKYRMESSGHVVRLYSYDQDHPERCETCKVAVLQEDNGGRLKMERRVFGIKFADLEPLDVDEEARAIAQRLLS